MTYENRDRRMFDMPRSPAQQRVRDALAEGRAIYAEREAARACNNTTTTAEEAPA